MDDPELTTRPVKKHLGAQEFAVGDRVCAGPAVVVVAATRTGHTLRAPQDAIVGEVAVTPGARVGLRETIAVLEAVPDPEGER